MASRNHAFNAWKIQAAVKLSILNSIRSIGLMQEAEERGFAGLRPKLS